MSVGESAEFAGDREASGLSCSAQCLEGRKTQQRIAFCQRACYYFNKCENVGGDIAPACTAISMVKEKAYERKGRKRI